MTDETKPKGLGTDGAKAHLANVLTALAGASLKRHKKIKDDEGRVVRSFSWPGTGLAAVVATDADDRMVDFTLLSSDLDPDDVDELRTIVPPPKFHPIKVRPASPMPISGDGDFVPHVCKTPTNPTLLSDFYFAWDPAPDADTADFVGGGLFGIIPKDKWDAEHVWDDEDRAVNLIPDDAPIEQEMECQWAVVRGAAVMDARQWLLDNGAVENIDILNWESYQTGEAPRWNAAKIQAALDECTAKQRASAAVAAQKVAQTVLSVNGSGQLSNFYFARDMEFDIFGDKEDADRVVLVEKAHWDANRTWGGPWPTQPEIDGLPIFHFGKFMWQWEPVLEWPEVKAILEAEGAVYNTALRSGCHHFNEADTLPNGHPFPHRWIAKDPVVETVVKVVDSLLGNGVDVTDRPDLRDGDDDDFEKATGFESVDELLFEAPDQFLGLLNTGIPDPIDPILGAHVVAALNMMASVDVVWEDFTTDWNLCRPDRPDGGEQGRAIMIVELCEWALGKRKAVDGEEVEV